VDKICGEPSAVRGKVADRSDGGINKMQSILLKERSRFLRKNMTDVLNNIEMVLHTIWNACF